MELPWNIQPMTVTNWTWKHSTFWLEQNMAEWNETKHLIMQDVWFAPKENTYSWLPAASVDLWDVAPLCVEKRNGSELVGWTPLSLSFNVHIDLGYGEANS